MKTMQPGCKVSDFWHKYDFYINNAHFMSIFDDCFDKKIFKTRKGVSQQFLAHR
ncbi:hypothetical protein FACS189429_6000 [Bacteroidia bacterium]|nr:hypothetical protein FACS189429_6000 [Bacteroidia bacterium]